MTAMMDTIDVWGVTKDSSSYNGDEKSKDQGQGNKETGTRKGGEGREGETDRQT